MNDKKILIHPFYDFSKTPIPLYITGGQGWGWGVHTMYIDNYK